METLQLVETMSDDQVLATFGTAEDPIGRGFDDATHTSVISGADAPASSQAILDVVAAISGGTPLR